jgi:hypothetical protein
VLAALINDDALDGTTRGILSEIIDEKTGTPSLVDGIETGESEEVLDTGFLETDSPAGAITGEAGPEPEEPAPDGADNSEAELQALLSGIADEHHDGDAPADVGPGEDAPVHPDVDEIVHINAADMAPLPGGSGIVDLTFDKEESAGKRFTIIKDEVDDQPRMDRVADSGDDPASFTVRDELLFEDTSLKRKKRDEKES